MQQTLNRAIEEIGGEPVTIYGSGRTDRGAHAVRQVVAFTTRSRLPARTWRNALNARLPRDIAVAEARDVSADFHPRYDARSRTYRYYIWNRDVRSPFLEHRAAHVREPLNADCMHEAARYLVGRSDLTSFVPMRTTSNRTRTVFAVSARRREDMVVVEIKATGFMRQMVRSIVGTLIDVGAGRLDAEGFRAVVDARDRERAGKTAPAYGLYLVDVGYDDPHTATSPDRSAPLELIAPGAFEETR